MDLEFQEFDTIFNDSNFFQLYAEFVRSSASLRIKKSSLTENPFYNEKFASVLLKKYIAYLPLWSSLLTAIRSTTVQRTNNGMVEGKIIT